MITIKTNIGQFVQITTAKLKNLADTDKMLRAAATTVLGLMKKRIHEDGLDADGKQIGTYSKGYMKIRTGDFGNSARVSRGKNKGKLKDAGVFTDRTIKLNKNVGVFTGEDKVGKPRPQYNRSSDPKVVASLTRQMENDEKVIALGENSYGIGFTNPLNYDKSQWVEATYKKEGKIFSLSENEQQAVADIAAKFTEDALS
jgi:hypothetical protein